jgi:putative transposase
MGCVFLPNYLYYAVQRGHNRQLVFAEEADHRYYIATLETCRTILYIIGI